ncbi:MAG TPA: DUF2076 domain-containing protein [Bradyrhizobium sp.]|nr:DUF2076 domain-containing protein [Bradyrhizobium sp.]
MTPQERQLVDDLFDRLAKLETAPRDPDAVAAISQGLRRAPNAVYALVQTTLLQDEALKRANARIQELEGGEPEQPKSGGFLDSMRDAIFGATPSRGSVPSVPPPDARSRPTWNTGQVMQQAQGPGQYGQPPFGQPPYGQAPYGQGYGGPPQGPMGGGGSFLGTAAAAAAGVVGGGLLMNSIRGMMGGGHQAGFGDSASLGGGRSPWSTDQSGSDLARDAGINDIGSGGGRGGDDSSRAGLFDQASNDYGDQDQADMDADDFGGDGGDSDYA